ncbi:hypothetical protein C8R45DRAFT_841518, partial [Mycena sanguinolenta]
PFRNSVFTTAEISFGDATASTTKNLDAAFDTMEAVTSIGSYDHTTGGHILFEDDGGMIELPPGTTVLFAGGAKRHKFAPVGKLENRFLFRQFCSAGVLRWIENGGRPDKDWEHQASDADLAARQEMRDRRGIRSFSKLHDIYVY